MPLLPRGRYCAVPRAPRGRTLQEAVLNEAAVPLVRLNGAVGAGLEEVQVLGILHAEAAGEDVDQLQGSNGEEVSTVRIL